MWDRAGLVGRERNEANWWIHHADGAVLLMAPHRCLPNKLLPSRPTCWVAHVCQCPSTLLTTAAVMAVALSSPMKGRPVHGWDQSFTETLWQCKPLIKSVVHSEPPVKDLLKVWHRVINDSTGTTRLGLCRAQIQRVGKWKVSTVSYRRQTENPSSLTSYYLGTKDEIYINIQYSFSNAFLRRLKIVVFFHNVSLLHYLQYTSHKVIKRGTRLVLHWSPDSYMRLSSLNFNYVARRADSDVLFPETHFVSLLIHNELLKSEHSAASQSAQWGRDSTSQPCSLYFLFFANFGEYYSPYGLTLSWWFTKQQHLLQWAHRTCRALRMQPQEITCVFSKGGHEKQRSGKCRFKANRLDNWGR